MRLIPWGMILIIACITSLGGLGRFAFLDDRSVSRLIDYQAHRMQGVSPQGVSLLGANLYVHSITEHCPQRDMEAWENWPQWILGQFYSPILRTQNAHWIVSGGRGDCSERAAVLQDLLKAYRVQSRFIGLGGHVVLEAQSQQGTWLLDPDYGVSLSHSIEELASWDANTLAPWLEEQGVPSSKSQEYASLLTTREDNVTLAWGEPLSPRLKRVEAMCELLVWVVPMLCWLAVAWSVFPVGKSDS